MERGKQAYLQQAVPSALGALPLSHVTVDVPLPSVPPPNSTPLTVTVRSLLLSADKGRY